MERNGRGFDCVAAGHRESPRDSVRGKCADAPIIAVGALTGIRLKNPIVRFDAQATLAALLTLTALVYAHGLSGGFIYDDTSFIQGNAAVQVSTTDVRAWAAAAFSFPGGVHQGRWLSMLSFAANHYFGGLDPFGFKLINLTIHLLNGVLVFLLLRALLALNNECAGSTAERSAFDGRLTAAVLAGLWLLLPINLTAVLYVSQRMESLSTTFVFLGLAWYVRTRLRSWRGECGAAGLWLSLLVCSGIGALVKESAALLPLYAACIEFAITGMRDRDGRWSRPVLLINCALLVAPLIVGVGWLASWLLGPQTYAHSFNTGERLLTESRVLVDYIRWTLVPNLDALTLYHDDIALSRGLIEPPTTLAAVIALLALSLAAIWQRRRRPLFTLGIAWFFCGHLLTATIIPLLLAFEHRNYFPSLGLLVASAALVAPEGRRVGVGFRAALVIALVCFYGFTTWMRAEEWSEPMRLTLSEAQKRPRSPLAQYERAAALLAAGTIDGRPVFEQGVRALDENRTLPGAGIAYEAGLIAISQRFGRPVSPDWWPALLEKLRLHPPEITDAQALESLSQCFSRSECKDGLQLLAQAYSAALAHPSPSTFLLSSYAEFAWQLQNDKVTAERQFRRVVDKSPRDPQGRRHLVLLLIAAGKLDEARTEIDAIGSINHFGMFDGLIRTLQASLNSAGSASPAN